MSHLFKNFVLAMTVLLVGCLGFPLTGSAAIEAFSLLAPERSSELYERAMKEVKKSRIRRGTVKYVHHLAINERLFDEFFPHVISKPASPPPVLFPLYTPSRSEPTWYTVVTDRLRETDYGLSWVGHIKDEPRSSVLFLANTEAHTMYGEIRLPGIVYEIRPAGIHERGIYAVFTVGHRALPPEDNQRAWQWKGVFPSSQKESSHPQTVPPDIDPAIAELAVPPVIDVMVLYSQNAIDVDRENNLAQQICYAVNQVQESFINSGISAQLRLVHHGKIDWQVGGGTETLATKLLDSTFVHSAPAHRNREKYGADIVSLWLGDGPSGEACGYSQLISDPAAPGSGLFAFSIVRRNCATINLTFGHELGHLMGADHDRFNAQAGTSRRHNYGYVQPNQNWMTIMGVGNKACNPCERLNYWSNPAKTYPPAPYEGQPMGRPANITPIGCKPGDVPGTGCDGPAYDASTLNSNAETVSKFMPKATHDRGHISCDVINPG